MADPGASDERHPRADFVPDKVQPIHALQSGTLPTHDYGEQMIHRAFFVGKLACSTCSFILCHDNAEIVSASLLGTHVLNFSSFEVAGSSFFVARNGNANITRLSCVHFRRMFVPYALLPNAVEK